MCTGKREARCEMCVRVSATNFAPILTLFDIYIFLYCCSLQYLATTTVSRKTRSVRGGGGGATVSQDVVAGSNGKLSSFCCIVW